MTRDGMARPWESVIGHGRPQIGVCDFDHVRCNSLTTHKPFRWHRRRDSRAVRRATPQATGDDTLTMLSLGEASRLTGRGKTTLARAIRRGALSATRNETGGYLIDPAELSRAYPFPAPGQATPETDAAPGVVAHHATEIATLTERVHGLQAMTEKLREWLADALEQRDRWQEQAHTAQRLLAAPPATPASPEPKLQPAPMSWWRWMRSTA